MNQHLPRRRALLSLSALGASLAVLPGCESAPERNCTDELDNDALTARKQLGYVAVAPSANKSCNTCNFYETSPDSSDCGRCKLLPGRVSERASCNLWVVRPPAV